LSDSAALAILHRDEHLLAVDKPTGLAVHRSELTGADDDFLVERVRRETARHWFLAHRLDRATSGVVLLAADKQVAAALGEQFMSRAVRKTYLAVCRGWPESPGTIDHPLDAPGRPDAKEATTNYRVLATHTWDIAMGRYPQQRYALVEVEPVTGRYRQIRRHFKHVSHHLIGDTSEGRGDHNRLFRQHLRVHRLLLHAWRIALAHPVTGAPLALEAPLDAEWHRVLDAFGWTTALDREM
jgi:tRNA pseudouridine65 synthase